jgi:hypothetical protein
MRKKLALGFLICILVFFISLFIILQQNQTNENNDEKDKHDFVEGYTKIDMIVPENLELIENVSNFNMIISNPLNDTMLIHDCFNLRKYSHENQTFEFIGNFQNINGQFFIDLSNLTDNNIECGNINLSKDELLSYKFSIKNAQVGKYKIHMKKAIMNIITLAQSFGRSNEFYLTI